MIRFSLRRGIRFFEGQRIWEIRRFLWDGRIQLEDQNSVLSNLSQEEIHIKYFKSEFEIDPESLNDDGSSRYFVVPREFSTYGEKEKKEAKRRERYLKRLLQDGPIKINACELTEKLKRLAKEFGEENPPSVSSIYRWSRRYKSAKDIKKLVPLNESKGRRLIIRGEMQEIVDQAVEEVYAKTPRNTKQAVYDRVEKLVETRNRQLLNRLQLAAPSRATLYRYLSREHRYTTDTARSGKNLEKTKYRSQIGSVRKEKICQRWEIDHTPIDLLVYCEKSNLPMGKPWLTVIIDHFSRMVMGFYISFQHPSYDSIAQALLHAILPKEEFLTRYPDIKCTWPAYGIPEEIFSDRGMDLMSDALENVGDELGILFTFCPAKQPQNKGVVERFNRTINYGLIHRIPGTVFGNTQQRDGYESEKEAAIGFETLVHLVTKWIVEIYNQSPHKGIKNTPFNKWSKGLTQTVIEYPESPEMLRIVVGNTDTRTLQHYGIELEGLKYNSQGLQDIRRHLGHDTRVELKIKYFEEDAGYIYVFHPTDKEYIQVDAIYREYASGLHRAEHRLIQKHLTEQMKKAVDMPNLLRAKEELRQLIEGAVHNKKMRNRKKSAELRGVNSNTPSGKQTYEQKPEVKSPRVEAPSEDDDLPNVKIMKKVINQPKEGQNEQ